MRTLDREMILPKLGDPSILTGLLRERQDSSNERRGFDGKGRGDTGEKYADAVLLALKMEERPLETGKGKKTDFSPRASRGIHPASILTDWKTTDLKNGKMIRSLSIQATKIVLICYSSSKKLE